MKCRSTDCVEAQRSDGIATFLKVRDKHTKQQFVAVISCPIVAATNYMFLSHTKIEHLNAIVDLLAAGCCEPSRRKHKDMARVQRTIVIICSTRSILPRVL